MCASGKRSRSARTAGVVNTTSPICRSRTNRILMKLVITQFAKNPISRFDGGFVDEHHRDVVLDWIDAMARAALERRPVLHQTDRRLTVRAGENLEQFWVDRHERNI